MPVPSQPEACTRQDAYRLRKLKDGLCTNCGKRRLKTETMCELCRIKMKKRFARNLSQRHRRNAATE